MPFGAFDPQRAVAILLGAREFPKAISLELHGTRFSNSALAFRKYLIEKLGIPRRNVLDLFDDASSPDQLVGNIRDFLDRRIETLKNTPLQDLFFYYVGHGFLEGRGISDLHLAIRQTDTDELTYTALDIRSLASVIRSRARFVRRYLILDCCYGAAASRAWSQSDGPARLAMRSAIDVFPSESPTRGTAVLSAAESDKEANALGKHEFTAFSDGLLHCLDHGLEELGEKISLESLHWMVVDYLRSNYTDADSFVRPKVESPEASEGDVAWIPIFPNPAYERAQEVERQKRAEQEQAAREAKERAEQERLKKQWHEEAESERQKNRAAQIERESLDRQAKELALEQAARKTRDERQQAERHDLARRRLEEAQRDAARLEELEESQRREKQAKDEAEWQARQIEEAQRQTQIRELEAIKTQRSRWLLVLAEVGTWGGLLAACFMSLLLGIGSEIITAFIVAGTSFDWLYYACAVLAGLIAGAIYAFWLRVRLPFSRLNTFMLGASWAFGWMTVAHSGFDPLAGVIGGAFISLLAFVRNRK